MLYQCKVILQVVACFVVRSRVVLGQHSTSGIGGLMICSKSPKWRYVQPTMDTTQEAPGTVPNYIHKGNASYYSSRGDHVENFGTVITQSHPVTLA